MDLEKSIDDYLERERDAEGRLDCNWVHHEVLSSVCGPSTSDRYANGGGEYWRYRGCVFKDPPPIVRQALLSAAASLVVIDE